jgi:NADH-quinone oxidoreductase subunit C
VTSSAWTHLQLATDLGAAVGAEVTPGDATGTPCLDVPRERWTAALRHARDVLRCDMLDWLSAVDEPDGDPPGVDVVAHLVATGSAPVPAGTTGLRRLLVRTRVPAADPRLASATALWRGAAWHERETWEMFGVAFDAFEDGSGHGLRPLLLPDGFEGTPLRKSFVLAARAAKAWPGAKEPGESGEGRASPSRRKLLPPGVPDPATWGPHRPAPAGGSGDKDVAPTTRTSPDRAVDRPDDGDDRA